MLNPSKFSVIAQGEQKHGLKRKQEEMEYTLPDQFPLMQSLDRKLVTLHRFDSNLSSMLEIMLIPMSKTLADDSAVHHAKPNAIFSLGILYLVLLAHVLDRIHAVVKSVSYDAFLEDFRPFINKLQHEEFHEQFKLKIEEWRVELFGANTRSAKIFMHYFQLIASMCNTLPEDRPTAQEVSDYLGRIEAFIKGKSVSKGKVAVSSGKNIHIVEQKIQESEEREVLTQTKSSSSLSSQQAFEFKSPLPVKSDLNSKNRSLQQTPGRQGIKVNGRKRLQKGKDLGKGKNGGVILHGNEQDGLIAVKFLLNEKSWKFLRKEAGITDSIYSEFFLEPAVTTFHCNSGKKDCDFANDGEAKVKCSDSHFMAMPLLPEPKTLGNVLFEKVQSIHAKGGGLLQCLEYAAHFFQRMIQAVARVHAAKIVHFDLSAGNFLEIRSPWPGGDGREIIAIDFGWARVFGETIDTMPKKAMAESQHLAPEMVVPNEHIEFEGKKMSRSFVYPATDFFSLGHTLLCVMENIIEYNKQENRELLHSLLVVLKKDDYLNRNPAAGATLLKQISELLPAREKFPAGEHLVEFLKIIVSMCNYDLRFRSSLPRAHGLFGNVKRAIRRTLEEVKPVQHSEPPKVVRFNFNLD